MERGQSKSNDTLSFGKGIFLLWLTFYAYDFLT